MLKGFKNGFPKALTRSMNTTIDGIATDMVSLLRTRYNYKATPLRARLTKDKARYTKLSGSVTSKGKDVHLIDVLGTRQTQKGVSVNVKKATGRQLIPHAFIPKSKKLKKKIVFIRSEESGKLVPRYPIEARYAPHPETLYNTGPNWEYLRKKANARMDKNFAKEIDVILKGYA